MSVEETRIGIMGGSFDPVHLAHVSLGGAAFRGAGLKKVVFLPAYSAPLRSSAPKAGALDRLEMLRIALEEVDYPVEISELEVKSGEVRYSVDSARELSGIYGGRLFWIIGGDHLVDLHLWRDAEELCELVSFVCAARPGFCKPSNIPKNADIHLVDFEESDISSTFIRKLLSEKKFSEAGKYLNSGVLKYILEKGLYI